MRSRNVMSTRAELPDVPDAGAASRNGTDLSISGAMGGPLASSAMHRLCQPLTALQCLLELGVESGDPRQLKAFMQDSLQECVRAVGMMTAFRDLLEMAGSFSPGAEMLDARAAAIKHGFDWREAVADQTQENGLDGVTLKLNPEGLDQALRQVETAIASAMGGPENAVCNTGTISQAPDASGTAGFAGSAARIDHLVGEIAGSAEEIVREAIATADGLFYFLWHLDFSGEAANRSAREAAWLRECEWSRPFDSADFDFARKPLPGLAIARVAAEAMGGHFSCSPSSVAIEFQIAGGEHPEMFSQDAAKLAAEAQAVSLDREPLRTARFQE